MTLPNILTVFRIFLTFIFIALLLQTGLWPKIAAAIVFLFASFTDYFDGYYAKKYELVSDFGKIMDPIADKFLMLSAFFIFSKMHIIPLWMVVIIAIREILITLFRLYALRKGAILSAEIGGKYKTVSQIVAVTLILIFIILREFSHLAYVRDILSESMYGIYMMMFIVVVMTLYSGVSFLWNNRGSLIFLRE